MTGSSTARRLAWMTLGLLVMVAAMANFLATDRPLILSLSGELYVFPNVIDYGELDGLTGEQMSARMDDSDWAVWAPIRHHPNAVRTAGTIDPVASPSAEHWLGTDDRGRDVAARLIHGTKTTALTALGAAFLALLSGLFLAVIAVWSNAAGAGANAGEREPGARLVRFVDTAVISLCDAAAAMPALLLVVAAQGLVGRASLMMAIVLIAIPRAADTARIARGVMLAALAQPFCQAAHALGASRLRVIVRHACPQAIPHLAVATALTAATAVLAEAALSFLGFGAPPPDASWGDLLRQAHENNLRWHLLAPAGLAVFVAATALGALGQPRGGTGEPANLN